MFLLYVEIALAPCHHIVTKFKSDSAAMLKTGYNIRKQGDSWQVILS